VDGARRTIASYGLDGVGYAFQTEGVRGDFL
jgi:hypothetical protein